MRKHSPSPKKRLLLIALITLTLSGSVFAENKDKCKNAKQEKVSQGVVASVGRYGNGAAVQGDTSGSTPGDDVSVISGSIKNISEGKCAAVIMNASECKTYTVSFAVKVSKIDQAKMSTITTSSASLSPGSSKEVPFSCNSLENNYAVEVTKVK